MAIVIYCPTSEIIGVDECVDELKSNLDPRSEDSYLQCADTLKKLSNNKQFLGEYLNDLLTQALNGKHFQRSTRIFPFYECESFTLRALIWEPVPEGVNGAQFFYNIPHDHDFDFITVSYFGPPLASQVYQYDNTLISGYPGEPVAIEPQGKLAVEPGTVHFYRAGKDIHTQLAPPSLAVTLNVIGPKRVSRSPWWFDVDQGKIVDWVDHTENAQTLLIRAAQHLFNDETAELVRDLSLTSPSPVIRAVAKDVYSQLVQEQ
jgi:hypothetical protein